MKKKNAIVQIMRLTTILIELKLKKSRNQMKILIKIQQNTRTFFPTIEQKNHSQTDNMKISSTLGAVHEVNIRMLVEMIALSSS